MADSRRVEAIRPLFLFSLPRTGSTLVQRVLGAHSQIATAGEPWVLLPLLYARREQGVRAEYWHQTAAQAIQDFEHAIPEGSFERRMREFVTALYADGSSNGAVYFLDKSPHYHFVVDEVIRLFPNAKFVFLWRNPLGVLASLLESFRSGHFTPYSFQADLERAPLALTSSFERHRDRAFGVRFEDLVAEDRERHWRDLFAYLELDWDASVLERFAGIRLEGRLGDPTGIHRYDSLSREPLDKWRSSLNGRVRQVWCRRWLRRLGSGPLATMGYDLEELLRELEDAGTQGHPAAVDLAFMTVSLVREGARVRALRIQDPLARPDGSRLPTRLLRAAASRLQAPSP